MFFHVTVRRISTALKKLVQKYFNSETACPFLVSISHVIRILALISIFLCSEVLALRHQSLSSYMWAVMGEQI